MELTFINHSSFVIKHEGIGLLCDYWQSGRVFNEGWALLCEPATAVMDFTDITHLWFSHEHPDHFSPADIMAIPQADRARITVLFQQTADHRVASFCRKAGFLDVIEMPAGETLTLAPRFTVRCDPFGAPWGDVDSWLLIDVDGFRVLNINDCEIHDSAMAAPIVAAAGPVDLLTTQFSYAARQGNPDEPERRKRSHDSHLAFFVAKVGAFNPRYVMPFASFVYWCQEDNWYLNEGIVRVDEAVAELAGHHPDTAALVLYPQDNWSPDQPWDNARSLERYSEQYAEIESRSRKSETCESIPADQLLESAGALAALAGADCRRHIAMRHFESHDYEWPLPIRLLAKMVATLRQRIEPLTFHVPDLKQQFVLTSQLTLNKATCEPAACDLVMRSDSLAHCLGTAFGGETALINGRFTEQTPGAWARLYAICYLARRLDQGLSVPPLISNRLARFLPGR